MQRKSHDPETVFATFVDPVGSNVFGEEKLIEVRSSADGCSFGVFYPGATEMLAGSTTIAETIMVAQDLAETWGFRRFAITDDGEQAVADECVRVYLDGLTEGQAADVDELLRVQLHRWDSWWKRDSWPGLGLRNRASFQRCLRNSFFLARSGS